MAEAADDNVKPTVEEEVTVMDEYVEVLDYRAPEGFTKTWKLSQYPLNSFKLTGRRPDVARSTSSHFNLYIDGPPISNMKIEISKTGFDTLSFSRIEEDYDETEKLEIDGDSKIGWDFKFESAPPAYTKYLSNGSSFIAHALWLTIKCSTPSDKQLLFNGTGSKETPFIGQSDEFFDRPEFGDFKVKVGERIFHVSKLALAIGSPVFKRLLCHNLVETEKGCIEIKDLSVQVVEKMLQFIYNPNVQLNNDPELAENVIKAADKYEIEKLRELYERVLLMNITMENVVRLVILADRCNCQKLRQACIDLICANYKDFIKTNECELLYQDHTKLAIEISGAAALK